MTTDHSLDEKIRACVLELVESAPPAPVLQLDPLQRGPTRRRTPSRRTLLAGVAIAASLVVVASLLVAQGSSSQEVSESQLGMRLTSLVNANQPVLPGSVAVASGTFFGHRWVLSGANPSGGHLCAGLSYRGSFLFGGCHRVGSNRVPGSRVGSPPFHSPPWARSTFISTLGTTSDRQRFLVAATNGTVTKLTVRAHDGTFVTATTLPQHLGTASFFVLSLGRERGPCYELCEGSVRLTLSTPTGPSLINNASSVALHDWEGIGVALSAPLRH